MLTKAQKAKFVRQLCRSVEKSVIAQIPKMPDEWDGHELRELLAETFDRETTLRIRPMRKRLLQYEADCARHGIRAL